MEPENEKPQPAEEHLPKVEPAEAESLQRVDPQLPEPTTKPADKEEPAVMIAEPAYEIRETADKKEEPVVETTEPAVQLPAPPAA